MIYKLHFLPQVEEDALAAYSWYEGKSPGLGEEFLRVFYAGANEIFRNPLLFSKIQSEFRRYLLRRFPYAMYFTLEENRIIIFGLFHCARDPRAIRLKLGQRKK